MDRLFEQRKLELERECEVPEGLFDESLMRLAEFMKPFVGSLARADQRHYAQTVVQGLCSDLQRKNAESIAYHFGLDRKTIQHFVGGSGWDDVPLRAELARQIARELGDAEGVIVFDPSGFPKAGRESVGVARQWCGRLGKIDNCQVGLFLGYVSRHGHALVDGDLFLPEEWTKDKPRMRKAQVPKEKQRHRTRHETFLQLLDRHGPNLPHGWIAGDDELGRPVQFRRDLQARNERYLLAVPCNTKVHLRSSAEPKNERTSDAALHFTQRSGDRVDQWTNEQPADSWQRFDVRDTEKGPLLVEALRCAVATGNRSAAGLACETLVVIRYLDRDRHVVKRDYYLSNAPDDTPLLELVRVAKAAHRIEECFERGKGEAGMADYEVRNWIGWQHHQTLSLLAAWFLTGETRRGEKKDTCHHHPSSACRHRGDHPPGLPLRRVAHRPRPHREAPQTKSTCQAISLETTQTTTAHKLAETADLGQSK
jgi:SRSO17 transposase